MIHPTEQATVPPLLAELQETYPGWSVWQSDGGCCYATRRSSRTPRTLDADDPEGLATELARQADAERRTA